MSLTLKKAFAILGIKYVSDQMPKMKFVQKRFYQLSLVHHPDRPGGDNLIQQKIAEAFQFIGDYILQNYYDQDDSEEEAARHVFKALILKPSRRIFSHSPSKLKTISPIYGIPFVQLTMGSLLTGNQTLETSKLF